jgi:hypothetical protein
MIRTLLYAVIVWVAASLVGGFLLGVVTSAFKSTHTEIR